MFDPIPAHELCKYFVCKVASPITDDSPRCSESAQFFCKKLTTVLASFFGQAIASTHLET